MSGKCVVVCLLTLVVVLGLLPSQASAQGFTLGPYFFSNSVVSEACGTGLAMTLRTMQKQNTSLDVSFVFAKSSGQIGGDTVHGDASYESIMYNLQSQIPLDRTGTSRAFVGFGFGAENSSVSLQSDHDFGFGQKTSLAWQAFAGVNVSQRLFVEAKLFNAT